MTSWDGGSLSNNGASDIAKKQLWLLHKAQQWHSMKGGVGGVAVLIILTNFV